MKQKGFTLIELLAVIVILAIIALIATPIILNIIESSRESAAIRSAELYIDALQTNIATKNINESFSPDTCTIDNKVTSCEDKEISVVTEETMPLEGNIMFNNGMINYATLKINEDYTVVLSNGNYTIQSDSTEIESCDEVGEDDVYTSFAYGNSSATAPTFGIDLDSGEYMCTVSYSLSGANTASSVYNTNDFNSSNLSGCDELTIIDSSVNRTTGTAKQNSTSYAYMSLTTQYANFTCNINTNKTISFTTVAYNDMMPWQGYFTCTKTK